MSKLRLFGVFLIVLGVLLLVHHGITTGIVFDMNDLIGHDWYGVILILIGNYLLFITRAQRNAAIRFLHKEI